MPEAFLLLEKRAIAETRKDLTPLALCLMGRSVFTDGIQVLSEGHSTNKFLNG